VGEAGLAVELEVDGARPGVPPGVDLSAYRIVQESLTNVLKHAGPARDRIRAKVSVRYGDHDVVVEVVDDGRGAAGAEPARTGHGIAGMRERAAVFGGELVAGPRPGGGFRVAARLPFEAGSR
jgi:signal transduction histidine kinase